MENGSPKQLDGVLCCFQQGKLAHHWNSGSFSAKMFGKGRCLGMVQVTNYDITHTSGAVSMCFMVQRLQT